MEDAVVGDGDTVPLALSDAVVVDESEALALGHVIAPIPLAPVLDRFQQEEEAPGDEEEDVLIVFDAPAAPAPLPPPPPPPDLVADGVAEGVYKSKRDPTHLELTKKNATQYIVGVSFVDVH